MTFLVECHSCSAAKRPLVACEACGAEPAPREERRAWREAAHGHHLARLTAGVEVEAAPRTAATTTPRRLVIQVDDAALRLPPLFDEASAEPLAFDWHERRGLRRLRRAA